MPRQIRSRKEILLSAAGGAAAMNAENMPAVSERAGSPFNLRPAVTGSDLSRKRVRGALFRDSAARDLPELPEGYAAE